jgi:putative oxidoreductase
MTTPTPPVASGIANLYDLLVRSSNHLQSVFLFAVRFIWGIQLMQAGVGKLLNIDTPIGYFTQLGIPFPVENAWLVATTETFGGMFLALGLLTRLTAIPLIINFIVAYLTTEMDALHKLLKLDTDDFFAAAPFLFLFAAILILTFGPGAYSLDFLINNRWRKATWKSAGL